MVDKTDAKIVFLGLGPTLSTLKATKVGHIYLKLILTNTQLPKYCSNQFCPLWILDCKDKARQKCKNNKKTMILEKYLDFHTARNQGR